MTDSPTIETSMTLTWEDYHRDARDLVLQLGAQGPWQGMAVVTRGGLHLAGILAWELNIRQIETINISSYTPNDDDSLAPEARSDIRILKPFNTPSDQWLIVDDLVDSGATMRAIRKMMPNAHVAVLYAKPDGLDQADSYVETVGQDTWIHFPWETEIRPSTPLHELTNKAK
jgi:xanthine phosphoribosyltransferase